jgi:hypothetical protein
MKNKRARKQKYAGTEEIIFHAWWEYNGVKITKATLATSVARWEELSLLGGIFKR